jgi:hypothetical protein
VNSHNFARNSREKTRNQQHCVVAVRFFTDEVSRHLRVVVDARYVAELNERVDVIRVEVKNGLFKSF